MQPNDQYIKHQQTMARANILDLSRRINQWEQVAHDGTPERIAEARRQLGFLRAQLAKWETVTPVGTWEVK